MKIKKLLLVLLAVLLVFSLFGCGKKEPVADVEPQDTVEQEKLPPIVTEKDTPKQEPVELTQEELHALFKKEYEFFKWAKANLYDDQYQEYYLKLPAREIGTQTDANVYADIEKEVAKPEYEGKILPDDGFEQYVAWREALEKGSSSGNNQSGNNSGNTSNTGNTGGQTQQKPSTKPSGGSNNSSGGSSNNGGSSGNSGNSSGGNGGSGNVYDDAHITNTVPDNGDFGESSIEKDYEKPSYDIIG